MQDIHIGSQSFLRTHASQRRRASANLYSSCLCNRHGALRRSCSIDFPVPDSLMVEQQRRGRTLCRDGLSARGGRLGAGSHSALFPTRSGRTAAPNSLEANPELQAQEKKKKILEGPAPAMAAAAARPKLGNGEAIGGLLEGRGNVPCWGRWQAGLMMDLRRALRCCCCCCCRCCRCHDHHHHHRRALPT